MQITLKLVPFGHCPSVLGKDCFCEKPSNPSGRSNGTVGGGEFERQALEEAAQAIKDRQSFFKRYVHTPTYEEPGLGCTFKVSLLVEVVSPGLQLVVCGAGHVGSALLRFARQLHFETILLDNRNPDLNKEKMEIADRFILCDTFEQGVLSSEIAEGAYYVCCASTHTQDKSALKGALQKSFAYVGMLGSVKKTKEMYRQLADEGISSDLLELVHTPIGLDVCDMSPEEVSFSIMAEILMIKNGGTGKPRKALKTSP